MLEIEIDQAGRGLAALGAVEQHHRGLHRQRGHAGAADGRQKGVDLRLARLDGDLRIAGALGHPRAGAHQIHRRHRLHQKIRDPHLQQGTRDIGVESLGDHDHRRPSPDLLHQPLERGHLLGAAGIEIDHRDGGIGQIEPIGEPFERGLDHPQCDLVAGAERRPHLLRERRVAGEHDHLGRARCAVRAAAAHGASSSAHLLLAPATGAAAGGGAEGGTTMCSVVIGSGGAGSE